MQEEGAALSDKGAGGECGNSVATGSTIRSSVSKRRLIEYVIGKKNAAYADLFRLIGVLVIAFASIVCIALDKERQYFTNVLTFVIGIIVDSPLTGKKEVGEGSPPASAGK